MSAAIARALACAALGLAAAGAGCRREERRFDDIAAHARPPQGEPAVTLHAGPAPGPPDGEQGRPDAAYGRSALSNAVAVSRGRQLYQWFGCVGCHAGGGGNIGPPLMDAEWIYGHEPEQVYASIVHGRPNGMPAFGGKIPERELWQLVAYVLSLSSSTPLDTRTGRSDAMATRPPSSLAPQEEAKGDPRGGPLPR